MSVCHRKLTEQVLLMVVVVSECIRVGTRSPVPQLPNRVSLTLLTDPLQPLLPRGYSLHSGPPALAPSTSPVTNKQITRLAHELS
eukprot:SAG31_NODE_5708_length_2369_cov_2.891630_1_plen_84_part_10